ncbi:hypothetical protein [Arthrobacter sp. KNU40]|uniref:hypothetical protein n=1 Tax=Arthrobacter sp. KNU40 TaxID=3447965 RepID=UPI003F5F837D
MNDQASQSKHDNPMHALSNALGDLQYPVPESDLWLRIVFTLLPCSALIVVSVFWTEGAPFLLTFAGAFASIQLGDPYKRASQLLVDFLAEAREQRRSALEHLRIKLAFRNSAIMYEGVRPIGYSRAGLQRARRRFPRLSRRWDRSFWDVSGRIRDPETGALPPVAIPRWLYPRRDGFKYWDFVRRGQSIAGCLLRTVAGTVPLIFSHIVGAYDSSRGAQSRKQKRAEKLLARLSVELVRATRDRGSDAPVVQLAKQLGLTYQPPEIKDNWAFSDQI